MVEVTEHRRRHWPVLAVAIIVIAVAIGAGPRLVRSTLAADPWPFDPHTVGSPCPDDASWVCGSIEVPLDRSVPNSETIAIRFRILPRQLVHRASVGTVVAVNGGPGDPSMNLSTWARKTFAPLLTDHDLLLVDNRGSGASERIDCPGLEKSFTEESGTQCSDSLGSHADDYGTVAAVDDLEAVLERVHARAVDMYGESYGTFFAQVFALRHPQLLQRLVLDGALPLDVDPWRVDSLPAGVAGLRTTCRADPTCAASGDVIALLAKVLARVRVGIPKHYISRRAFNMGLLLANAGRAGSAYRELPAAMRAYLVGDEDPLFRLTTEAQDGGFANEPASASEDSLGLLVDEMCTDYVTPFDLRAPLTKQKSQLLSSYDHIVASIPTDVAPFTAQETLRGRSECLGWPAPTEPTPQTIGRDFPDVPTLVLDGDLDTVTPPRGAHRVAGEFRHSIYIGVPFVGHITASTDHTGCSARIATAFLASRAFDTACLASIRAQPQVDVFPLTFAQEPPATALDVQPKVDLSENARRTIAITRDLVSDVLWRWKLGITSGHGLRGGTYAVGEIAGERGVSLDAVRWTTDTTVSGRIYADAIDQSMTGELDVSTPAGQTHVEVSSPRIVGASTVEKISGTFGGHEVDVTVDGKLGL